MTIDYDRTGDGPPLVLLHPLGADRRVWDPIVGPLSAAHEVIAVDLPGFGQSPPLRATTPTPGALAEAVAELLRDLGVEQPHVVGNSLGGWVALQLALAGHTGRVTAIAPAGLWSAPLVPKPSLAHRVARALEPLIEPAARTRRGRRLLLSGSVAYPERIPGHDAAHLVRAYARSPGFIAVNDAMRAATFTALDQIRCPVTMVWPDHDRLVERPARLPGNVISVTLPDAGHVPMWDAPAALVALITDAGRHASQSISAA
jgi:pimeloyl-ACP methyl ester carboxylesterase